MSDKLGFGLYGTGLVAPFHANALRDCKGGKLVAVAGRTKDKVDKLAADYGAKAYYSLEEMLKDPRIKVVNVLTPNHVHFEPVVQCAKAGKHIILEKPPAMTLRETDEMVRICADAGMKFACAVQCRVRAAIQAMKKALDAGRFGRLLHADTTMKWFREAGYYQMNPWRSLRAAGAGVTVQHAFHYIDLLQYLAGPVAKVQATMSNLTHPTVQLEDTLLAFLWYKSGAQGVVEASTALWPGTDVRIELSGTTGAAIMSGEKMTLWKFREERPEDEHARQLGSAAQATAASGPAAFGYADHKTLIEDMISAIREDREVIIPVSSVRHTVEIALAMYQSATHNRPVELPIEDDPSIWEK
jgi:predicted dehydrogenase